MIAGQGKRSEIKMPGARRVLRTLEVKMSWRRNVEDSVEERRKEEDGVKAAYDL